MTAAVVVLAIVVAWLAAINLLLTRILLNVTATRRPAPPQLPRPDVASLERAARRLRPQRDDGAVPLPVSPSELP